MNELMDLAPYIIGVAALFSATWVILRLLDYARHSISDEAVLDILDSLGDNVLSAIYAAIDAKLDVARERAEQTETPIDDFIVDNLARIIEILRAQGLKVEPPDDDSALG
jgi:hypothetical protein